MVAFPSIDIVEKSFSDLQICMAWMARNIFYTYTLADQTVSKIACKFLYIQVQAMQLHKQSSF